MFQTIVSRLQHTNVEYLKFLVIVHELQYTDVHIQERQQFLFQEPNHIYTIRYLLPLVGKKFSFGEIH